MTFKLYILNGMNVIVIKYNDEAIGWIEGYYTDIYTLAVSKYNNESVDPLIDGVDNI